MGEVSYTICPPDAISFPFSSCARICPLLFLVFLFCDFIMLNTIYMMSVSFQADTLPASPVVHLQLQGYRCRKQPAYAPTLSELSFELSTLINFRDLKRFSVPDLFLPDLLTISPTGKIPLISR